MARIITHEAVCAERYSRISETLTELKNGNHETKRILWAVAGALLLAFLGVLIKFIFGA